MIFSLDCIRRNFIMFHSIVQEATRFLMFVFKKVPLKRPSAEECHEHRWLAQSDFIHKKRERAVFLGNRLKVSGATILSLAVQVQMHYLKILDYHQMPKSLDSLPKFVKNIRTHFFNQEICEQIINVLYMRYINVFRLLVDAI